MLVYHHEPVNLIDSNGVFYTSFCWNLPYSLPVITWRREYVA